MKRMTLAVLLVFGGIQLFAQVASLDSCEQPGRQKQICYSMKELRSHVLIFETQRELVQANFKHLSAALQSFRGVIGRILSSGFDNPHFTRLNETAILADQAMRESQARDPRAFATVNAIKTTCLHCHNANAPQGLKADDIFRPSWDRLAPHCNEVGRNPFVCRHMNALVTYFNSFLTAAARGQIDYDMARENAAEVQRITRALRSFAVPIHEGGNGPLLDVERRAKELEGLALTRSPAIFEKAGQVSWSCLQCHKVR